MLDKKDRLFRLFRNGMHMTGMNLKTIIARARIDDFHSNEDIFLAYVQAKMSVEYVKQ